MDKVTRHELKTDKFATEVTHSIEYVNTHRQQAIRYGGAALAIVLVVGGIVYYQRTRAEARQNDLAAALHLKDAVVGPAPQPGDPRGSFGSQTEKDRAILKAYQDLAAKYPGTNEASIAHYELGVTESDAGKTAEAEKHFREAVDAGDKEYSSIAKLALAEILAVQGKTADADKLLRSLMDSPTFMVSKEQAAFSLARILAKSNPAEARKVLAPFEKDPRVTIARNAAALLSEIPAK